MNRPVFFVFVICIVIGAALFGDQVMMLFAGMSPLEAVKFIAAFVLHTAVATIVGMVALGLPTLIKPWLAVLRRKRRESRRAPQSVPAVRMPKRISNAELMRLWMIENMSNRTSSPLPPTDDDARLHF